MNRIKLIFLSVFMLISLSGCSKATVLDLNELTSVKVTGVNGRGKITLEDTGLSAALLSELGDGKTDYYSMMSSASKLEGLTGDIHFSKETDLSNGDKVKVTCDIDKNALKEYDIKFKFKPFTYTVENLKVVPSLTDEDIFKGVSLEYSGIAPSGSAKIVVDSSVSPISSSNYNMNKSSDLSNGDVITVTCYASDTNDYLVPEGLNMTKEFVVAGLDSYAVSVDEISQDELKKLYSKGLEMISDIMKKDSSFSIRFYTKYKNGYCSIDRCCVGMSNLKLEKVYFKTSKEPSGSNKNGIRLLYSLDTEFDSGGWFDSHNMEAGKYENCYISIGYDDIKVSASGESNIELGDIKCSAVFESFDDWSSENLDKEKYNYTEHESSLIQ